MKRVIFGSAVRRIALSSLAMACLLVAAAPAHARFSSKKAIWGPAYLNGISQFPRYKDLGVGIVQEKVNWRNVASTRPASPRDPNDPAYTWPAELDRLVADARRYRMRIALMIIGAPGWANGGKPFNVAATRPADYADFAYAASRRYPGVRLWMIWGEPSRDDNWQPMVPAPPGRRLTAAQAAAPRRYARMLDAAYGALKQRSRANRVIGGMTYTTGEISAWQWVRYMRLPNGRPPRLDLYGHNPFTWRTPTFRNPPSCCGISDFSDLARLAPVIDRNLSPRRRNGTRRRIPLFLSEFMLPTAPDSELNVWVDRPVQARWIRDIWRIVRRSSRIQAFGWVHFYDEPPDPKGGLVIHGGLLDYRGKPKPGYFAFKNG